MEELNPMFLLAVPQLGDPNFHKSVILVLDQGVTGAMGLIINSPISLTLGQLLGETGASCHETIALEPVYRGGPVEPDKGWILHTDESVEEKRVVLPGLFVSGSRDSLYTLLEKGQKSLRLMLGYSGWGPGQLHQEMVQGSWITTKATAKYIFDVPADQMWNRIFVDMGVDPNRLMMGGGLH